MLNHQPNRPLLHLFGISLASFHDPILSNSEVSGNHGAVQILFCEKALLVEGKTETRLLPYLYEKVIGRTLGMDKIALVPLGGSGGVKKASEIIEAMGLRYRTVVDLDFVFRHGAECGLLSDPDQNINTCMEYFAKRNQDGEIELDDLGLPKKNPNGLTAADVYAQCAESTDCTSSIASLHEQAKDRNVWAWPNGDIEKVLGIEGKGESVWARFTNEVEQRGLEERVNDLETLKAFTAWVQG
jgi:putative ATP-dependent endonuclease of OLD family